MGWSCSQLAALRMEAISAACIASTGSQNVIVVTQARRLMPPKTKYMIETSRFEHRDGAITGNIYKFTDGDNCHRIGAFKIEGNGQISNGPKWLKDIPFKIVTIDGIHSLWRETTDLHTYIKGPYIKQFMPGGVNAHLPTIPYPKYAVLTDQTNREIVLEEWKVAMFEVW